MLSHEDVQPKGSICFSEFYVPPYLVLSQFTRSAMAYDSSYLARISWARFSRR